VGRGEAGGGADVVRGGGAGCGTGDLELVRGVGVGSVGSKGSLQDGSAQDVFVVSVTILM